MKHIINRCSNCKYWRKTTKRSGLCLWNPREVFNTNKNTKEKRYVLTLYKDICLYYTKKENSSSRLLIEIMARYIGEITGSCPLDMHNYKGINCESLCDEEGRDIANSCWKCWIDYFTDRIDGEKKLKNKDICLYYTKKEK